MPAVLPLTARMKVAVYVAVIDKNGVEGPATRVGEADLATETYVTVKEARA